MRECARELAWNETPELSVGVLAADLMHLGRDLARLEEAALAGIEAVRRHGITADERAKAVHQLRARLVFENDSITNIAHQLGFFETIASWRILPTIHERMEAVTLDQIAAAASERLASLNRTVGWFEPLPVSA